MKSQRYRPTRRAGQTTAQPRTTSPCAENSWTAWLRGAGQLRTTLRSRWPVPWARMTSRSTGWRSSLNQTGRLSQASPHLGPPPFPGQRPGPPRRAHRLAPVARRGSRRIGPPGGSGGG
eukprot:11179243-Alexandrium_andersonii.AAC.1